MRREEAYHWVVNNQCSRRNLTPEQQRYLLGRKYTAEKKVKGAPRGNKRASKKQKDENHLSVLGSPRPTNPTRKKVAEEAGVTEHRVQKSLEYANALDNLHERGIINKGDVLSGKVKIPASRVVNW